MGRAGRVALLSLTMAHCMVHVYIIFFTPLLKTIALEFGTADYHRIGILATYVYAAYGIGGLPAGLITDRFGGKATTVASVALAALGALVAGFSTGLPQLAVGLVVMGFGASLYHPSGFTTLSGILGTKGVGRAMGVHGIGGNLGQVLGPLVTGILVLWWGWRAPFIIWAVPGFIGAFLAFRFLPKTAESKDSPGREAEPAGGVVRAGQASAAETTGLPSVVFIVLGLAASQGIFTTGIFAFLPIYLQDVRGQLVSTAAFTVSLLLYGVGILGQLLGGYLADHVSRRLPLRLGTLASAVVLVLIPFASPGFVLTAAIVTLGVAFFILQAPITTILADVTDPSRRGLVFGLLFVSQFTAGSLAPIAGGYVAEIYGLNMLLYLLGMVAGLGWLFSLFLPGEEKPAEALTTLVTHGNIGGKLGR